MKKKLFTLMELAKRNPLYIKIKRIEDKTSIWAIPSKDYPIYQGGGYPAIKNKQK